MFIGIKNCLAAGVEEHDKGFCYSPGHVLSTEMFTEF